MADGFRDGEGTYFTPEWWTGVWLSDTPLVGNEGAKGDDLIAVRIPQGVVEEFEWVNETSVGGYREFLVPAEVANRYPRRFVGLDEQEELAQVRFLDSL